MGNKIVSRVNSFKGSLTQAIIKGPLIVCLV